MSELADPSTESREAERASSSTFRACLVLAELVVGVVPGVWTLTVGRGMNVEPFMVLRGTAEDFERVVSLGTPDVDRLP